MGNKLLIFFLLVMLSCSGKSGLELRLENAVKDRKLSRQKSALILKEYDSISNKDEIKAANYAKRIREILDVGGDSSHVDLVRRQVLK